MTNKTALSIRREDTKREAERLKARNGVLSCHDRQLTAVHLPVPCAGALPFSVAEKTTL